MESSTQDRPLPPPSGGRPPIVWPSLVLGALTAVLFFTDLDLVIADAFYDPGVGFRWRYSLIGRVLHESCPVIVGLVVAYCLVVFVGSPRSAGLRAQRPAAAFLAVGLVLGPGLIVNGIFKGHFGRPRPFQVDRYGGEYPYQRVWVPTFVDGSESFPSGDASVGIFLTLPAFVLWRRRRRLAWAFLAGGLAAWAIIGSSRLAMGAHWTSDILWSAGFVYLTGHLTYWLLFDVGRRKRDRGDAVTVRARPAGAVGTSRSGEDSNP